MLPILQIDHASNLTARSRRLFYAFMQDDQSMAFLQADNNGQGADYLRNLPQHPPELREDLAWFHGFAESFTNLSVSRIRDVLLVDGDGIEEYTKMLEWGLGSELTYLRSLSENYDSLYLQQALRSAEREVSKLLPELERIHRITQQTPGGSSPVPTEIEELEQLIDHREFAYLLNEIGRRTSFFEGKLQIALDPEQKQLIRQAIGKDISLDLRASTDMPAEQREAINQNPIALFAFLLEIQEVYGYLYLSLLLEALPLPQFDGQQLLIVLTGIATQINQKNIPGAGAVNLRHTLLQIAEEMNPAPESPFHFQLLRENADTLGAGLATDDALKTLGTAANIRQGRTAGDILPERDSAFDVLLNGLRYEELAVALQELADNQPVTSFSIPDFGEQYSPTPDKAERLISFLLTRGYLAEDVADKLRQSFGCETSPPSSDHDDLLNQIDDL
jgi:hypothetical protein